MDEATDMAKADIWMPLYIGDYLADTMHLTTEQHGAYLLLIMAYWKNGGALSSDDSRLAATCRLSLDAWSMHKHTLASFFDTWSDPNLWILIRAEKEMEKAGNNQEKRTLRAQKAAAARWGGDAPSNAPSNAPSIQQALLNECPSPSPSNKDQKPLKAPPTPKPKKTKPKSDFVLPEWIDREAWEGFLAMRKEIKKPITENAKGLAVKKLEQFAAQGHNPAAILNQSTFHSWQGLFEVKNGSGQTNGQRSGPAGTSLIDQVRSRNAERAAERCRSAGQDPAQPTELQGAGMGEGGSCFDGEFARIRDTDGKIVGADD